MNPFKSYTDLRNKYPIQVIDLRFQVDHTTPKKNQLFEEFNTDTASVSARLFVLLFRRRQIEMNSNGNKRTEVEILYIINIV